MMKTSNGISAGAAQDWLDLLLDLLHRPMKFGRES